MWNFVQSDDFWLFYSSLARLCQCTIFIYVLFSIFCFCNSHFALKPVMKFLWIAHLPISWLSVPTRSFFGRKKINYFRSRYSTHHSCVLIQSDRSCSLPESSPNLPPAPQSRHSCPLKPDADLWNGRHPPPSRRPSSYHKRFSRSPVRPHL